MTEPTSGVSNSLSPVQDGIDNPVGTGGGARDRGAGYCYNPVTVIDGGRLRPETSISKEHSVSARIHYRGHNSASSLTATHLCVCVCLQN